MTSAQLTASHEPCSQCGPTMPLTKAKDDSKLMRPASEQSPLAMVCLTLSSVSCSPLVYRKILQMMRNTVAKYFHLISYYLEGLFCKLILKSRSSNIARNFVKHFLLFPFYHLPFYRGLKDTLPCGKNQMMSHNSAAHSNGHPSFRNTLWRLSTKH